MIHRFDGESCDQAPVFGGVSTFELVAVGLGIRVQGQDGALFVVKVGVIEAPPENADGRDLPGVGQFQDQGWGGLSPPELGVPLEVGFGGSHLDAPLLVEREAGIGAVAEGPVLPVPVEVPGRERPGGQGIASAADLLQGADDEGGAVFVGDVVVKVLTMDGGDIWIRNMRNNLLCRIQGMHKKVEDQC